MTNEQIVQSFYIAYYGRPGDPAGVDYWVNELNDPTTQLSELIASFGNSAEFDLIYGAAVTPEQFFETVYQNVLNRAPDQAGEDFWLGIYADYISQGMTEDEARAQLVIDFVGGISGGSPQDQLAWENKIVLAEETTDLCRDPNMSDAEDSALINFVRDGAFKDPFADVSTVAWLSQASGEVYTEFQNLIGNPGVVENLTTGIDTVEILTTGTIDTVKGVLGFNPMTPFDEPTTFQSFDTIEGNGLTRVEVSLLASSPSSYVAGTLSGVNELILKGAYAFGGFASFDATDYGTDISEISLTGMGGQYVSIDNLQADTTLAMAMETTGYLDVTGDWNGFTFSAYQSASNDGYISLSQPLIDMSVGQDSYGYLGLYLGENAGPANSSQDVVLGDMLLGDINLFADKSAELTLSISLYANDYLNWPSNSGDNVAIVGDLVIGDIDMDLRQNSTDSYVWIYSDVDASGTGSTLTNVAMAGDLVIGDIDINVATLAAFTAFSVYHSAYASGDAGVIASVEDMVVGDVTVTFAKGSVSGTADNGDDNKMIFQQIASASGTTGDATVGDMSFGNVTFTGGDAIYEAEFYASAYAYADTGDATVGDLVVGDVDFAFGDGDAWTHWYSFSAYRSATVSATGDARVGNVTIGNISMVAGDSQGVYANVFQSANAFNGDASVGDIQIGDVLLAVGDADPPASATFSVYNYASANSGDAQVGAITVGNIDVSVGDGVLNSAQAYVSIYAEGYVDGGALTFGDITIGDVDMAAQVSGSAYLYVYQTGAASGTGDSITLGNLTMGDVDMWADGFGSVYFSLTVGANENALSIASSMGNMTFGDIHLQVENSGYMSFSHQFFADDIGAISYGDLSLILGENSDLGYANISASADEMDIESFSIGTITLDMERGATESAAGIYLYANRNIGDINVGGIDFSAINSTLGASVYNTGFDLYAQAQFGSIGDVTYGDVSLVANGFTAWANHTATISADDDIASFAMGDVHLEAVGVTAWASNYMYLTAGDDIGDFAGGPAADISIGNLDILASGTSASAYYYFSATGGDFVGDLSVGNLSLDVYGDDAYAGAYIFTSGTAWGNNNTVGNIDVFVDNDPAAALTATASVSIDVQGNLTVGDISMTEGVNSALADNYGYVTLTSQNGNLVVGDITVTGGFDGINDENFAFLGEDSAAAYLVNLPTAPYDWWDDTVAGSVTVGDVDYSGYERYSVIDVSQWKGAENIWTSHNSTTGIGSDVYDNATKNVFHLNDGSDFVYMDRDNAGMTAATADQFMGFDRTDADLILIDFVAGTWNEFVSNTTNGTFDQFLTNAQTADKDIYAQKVGGDYFVAFDVDDDDTVDYTIQIVGATQVLEADFGAW